MSKLFRMLSGISPDRTAPIQTITALLVSLLAAAALAGVMMLVYRLCHDSLTYRRSFNVTLMMLTLASTLLLALIQNNPLLSLGALGALSICRIRTNTRDPRDLGFVFWALSIGISCAVRAFAAGIAGTVVLGAVMLLLEHIGRKKESVTMVVRGQKDQLVPVQNVLSQTPGSAIQAKNVFADSFELVYTLSIPHEEEKLTLLLDHMEGIDGVHVLAPETKVA